MHGISDDFDYKEDTLKTMGMLYRSFNTIFQMINNESRTYLHTVQAFHFKLFCENLHDLLSPESRFGHKLELKEHPYEGTYAKN